MLPTDQSVSAEVIAQDFFCMWIKETEGPIGRFSNAFDELSKSWKERFDVPLFRPLHPDDSNLLKQIRIPTIDSREEFETVVQSLARLIVEHIDETQFGSTTEAGSINKLSSYLDGQGIQIDCTPISNLQEIRSNGTAHAKGKKYDKAKERLLTGTHRRRDSNNRIINLLHEELSTKLRVDASL